jgi:hypothetical protein
MTRRARRAREAMMTERRRRETPSLDRKLLKTRYALSRSLIPTTSRFIADPLASRQQKKEAAAAPAKKEKDVRDKLTFHYCSLIDKEEDEPLYDWMEIDEHPLEWQLRNLGEFMVRELDSKPDPR